jgi:uncharacterized iron-regulated membrane protein
MFLKLLKKWVFWAHLVTGLVAGLFIFSMSFTGFLLTYERQIVELSEMSYTADRTLGEQRISTDQVVAVLQKMHPDNPHIYIRWVNREGAAIPAWAGKHSYLLHPYSGDILRVGEGNASAFFHVVTDIHRYLMLHGSAQAIGKNINGYANLFFIFLLLSGAYLWLPKRFNRSALKGYLLLAKNYKSSHHRNRQWHLVFGIWCLPVLFVLSLTATLFHFDWANTALYGAFGQSVPEREKHPPVFDLSADKMPYEVLFQQAKMHAINNNAEQWYSMWLELGDKKHEARFYIDTSIGHRQEYAYSLFLDTRTGNEIKTLNKSDWTPGDQAWGTSRFLHTGEYFGFIGQTIAGLASLLACFLVYTGTVLAWRRLVINR